MRDDKVKMNTNYIYDKRAEPRTHFPIQVRLTGRGKTRGGLAINTSRRGALIDAPGNYKRGDAITLLFKTELATLPPVQGRVVRAEPAFHGSRSLLGIEFDSPNAPLMDIVGLEKRLDEGTA